MKISVICTVLNEESSIRALLNSLLKQSLKPDEIVLVDGGSKDRTREIIGEYTKKNRRIRLYVERGSIAHGRNVAVRDAKNDIVAQIDAGCVARKDWLKKIIQPFSSNEVEVVAGFYEMIGDTSFQRAVAPYHGVPVARYDPRVFLPSGRSLAFRKDVWEKVGGYSESLERAGEDTLFNYKLLKMGVKIVRVPEAIVYWELPKNYLESLKKFYYYSKGDAQAFIWWHPAQRLSTHNIKVLTIFMRYFFALILFVAGIYEAIFMQILFILGVFYSCWAIQKSEDVVRDFRAKLWLPVIQFSSDLSVMVGFLSGLLVKPRLLLRV